MVDAIFSAFLVRKYLAVRGDGPSCPLSVNIGLSRPAPSGSISISSNTAARAFPTFSFNAFTPSTAAFCLNGAGVALNAPVARRLMVMLLIRVSVRLFYF